MADERQHDAVQASGLGYDVHRVEQGTQREKADEGWVGR